MGGADPDLHSEFQSTPLREGRPHRFPPALRGALVSIQAPARGASACGRTSRTWTFQSTPLREGRREIPLTRGGRPDVSIHAPARGATSPMPHLPPNWSFFNPPPGAWGDGTGLHEMAQRGLFQSTPLREGRLARQIRMSATQYRFQSTPLREGRRPHGRSDQGRRRVSIHAPARGATGSRRVHRENAGDVSIHAPARGATGGCRTDGLRSLRFNPRPCARGDCNKCQEVFAHVSIHAPARGATPACTRWRSEACFNPRPCARGDVGRPCGCDGTRFQSTPLREGRLWTVTIRPSWSTFQSTPLREGRPGSRCHQVARLLFQSTPLREGRRQPPAG